MARPRAFDEDNVLDNAMNVFWHKGFEGTSVQDLVNETGLNRASMYASFGDKKALFLRVLDHYIRTISAARFAKLVEMQDGRQAIVETFRSVMRNGLAEGRNKGCLMVNSGMELAPHDAETAAIARQSFKRTELLFVDALVRAQAQKTISDTKNIRALARFLAGSLQGLQLMARRAADEDTMRDFVDTALSTLD
ncbi:MULTISPECIES: TetR/AcrR family transcriptional regulator [unclassified Thalassospira]|jgi:TetR/AcrR family transcriptional repressor of nem operon|uniref:TetR/AcrR family transcriptional regulator n=1 Tax=unclassified Thalassospira TaxID=2648997 RepID=UPI000A1DF3D9|nr:TetR/AcrR family transcriptional regulator [Thalassospira sp. MCCC 1A01428]OSQ44431.1 TetR family transcriptional regulator [Thalassospira sp. MCCC 1A01428]